MRPLRTSATWLSTHPRSVVALCILLHLLIVVPLAVLLNIWIDEAYTMNTTGSSFSYALHQALHFEMQPPLYFVLMNVWRSVDDSVFWGRLFSILCACGSVVVTAKCVQRVLPDVHPGWVAITLALHPLYVFAAIEMRLYAFLLLLTSMMFLFFWDGFYSCRPSGTARVLFCLCATAALYTQYYAGFLLPAFGGALLVLRRWKALGQYLSTMLGVGVLFSPILFVLPAQLTGHPMPAVKAGLSAESVVHMGSILGNLVVPRGGFSLKVGMAITLAVGIVLVGITMVNRRQIRSCHVLVWTTCGFYSAALFLVLTQSSPDLMEARHACSAVILGVLSVFCCLSIVPMPWRRHLLSAYLSVFVVCSSFSMIREYRPMAKMWDSQRMAEYVMDNEQYGQPILLFYAEVGITFAYYYSGPNPLVPLPRAEDFKTYDLKEFVLTDTEQIEDALRRVKTKGDEVWLLTFAPFDYLGVHFNLELLEDYMKSNYALVSTRQFHRSTVRLFRRAAPHQE